MAARSSDAPLRVGVFGTGALGRHHTRILGGLPGVERIGIFDPRPEALRETSVTVTIFDGKVVYQRPAAASSND